MEDFTLIKKPQDSPNRLTVLQAGDTIRFYNLTDELLSEVSQIEPGIYLSKWVDFVRPVELAEIVDDHLFNYFKEQGTQKAILDIREISAISLSEIMPWLDEHFHPKLQAENLAKYRAILVSDSAFSQLVGESYENSVRSRSDNSVITGTFNDEKSALKWLRKIGS